MGSLYGKNFVRNDGVDGQGKQFLIFAKKINLTNDEVDRLFHEYTKYEDPQTRTLKISQILNLNKIKSSLIFSIIMQLFDRRKEGVLNFMEYVIILWGFLSADEDAMATFAFELFDINRYLDAYTN